jgi:hypothetical protein
MAAQYLIRQKATENMYNTYHNIMLNTKIILENAWIKGIDKDFSFLV